MTSGGRGGSTTETTATGGTTTASGGGGSGGATGGGGGGPVINEGFIGGPCESDADCAYSGGFCLPESEGFPGGMCSLDCDLTARIGGGPPSGRCLDPASTPGTTSAAGLCTVRCDYGQSPTGCREGYQCEPLPRNTEPRPSCTPVSPATITRSSSGPVIRSCWRAGSASRRRLNPNDHPDGLPDVTCEIEDPVWITPSLHGITYRPDSVANDPAPLFVACPMALAMDDASKMLADRGGTDLVHLGTTTAGAIAGTMTLSEHGRARALDIAAVRIEAVTRTPCSPTGRRTSLRR